MHLDFYVIRTAETCYKTPIRHPSPQEDWNAYLSFRSHLRRDLTIHNSLPNVRCVHVYGGPSVYVGYVRVYDMNA